MQTSLARRERRRRNGNVTHHSGGGVVSKVAVILPMFLLGTLVVLGAVTFVGAINAYSFYSADLQDPKQLLDNISFNQQTVLYDRTGTVELARFGSEHREVLTYDQMPNAVIDATTSAEDKTFWTNAGFDPRAVVSALTDALAGRPRGASTITQQLVRARLLPPTSSTAERKIKEILQSVRLTQEFPGIVGKQTILTDYLNLNFYGNQSYGIAAAAEGYFGVDVHQLTIAQAAILASLLQSPSADDLMANAVEQDDGSLVVPPTSAIVIRRNWVLDQMIQNQHDHLLLGTYDEAALVAAKSEPVVLHPAQVSPMVAPHFDVAVKQQLADLLCGTGTNPDDCEAVDAGGFKVITTIDTKMQASAEKWLKAYIMGPNQGSKQATINYLATLGITAHSDPFDYYRIVGPAPGTFAADGLRSRGIHNGALIAIDYRTGQVMAYAGSAGFYEKAVKNPSKPGQNVFDPQFDVLSNGWRQPGSAFKPINYITGIDDHTMTAATLFMDVQTNFGGGYMPLNAAGDGTVGPLRMRDAIQFSYNIPAVKAASINGVQHLIDRSHDFGLTFPPGTNPGVSIGIGTVEVHPADLASAYGAIANGGALVPRTMILSITDSKGVVVWPTPGSKVAVTHPVTPQAAYVMTNMLAGNTDPAQNWWWGQYKVMSGNTRRPATLKTGTSDQTEDLFAGGYVAPPADPKAPAIVAMVWAGNSDRSAGRGTMSLELAAPIWHDFIVDATAGTPVVDFKQPSGLVWAKVDANSGMLPGPYTSKTWNEVFIKGTVPKQVDNTKVPMDIDSATNTLWTDGCLGTKETRGFLDLSKVDAGNANFQKYDAIWIAKAKRGQEKKFYKNGWGAPFPPSNTCVPGQPLPTPTPGPGASGTPRPGPTPTPGPGPTNQPPGPPKPTKAPKPRLRRPRMLPSIS